MRYRRRFRNPKMTEEQKELERYADRAGVRLLILGTGLSERFKYIDSSKDLEILQSIIDNDLDPAIKLAERSQADLEASFSKRSKTSPGPNGKDQTQRSKTD